MAVCADIYTSENALYPISSLGKYGIILLYAYEYPSTRGSISGAIGQLIYMIEGF